MRTIRFRLTLWYASVLALVLATFAVSLYIVLRSSLTSNLDDALAVRIEELLPLVNVTGGAPTVPTAITTGGDEPGDAYIRLYDSSGIATANLGADSITRPEHAITIALTQNRVPQTGDTQGPRGAYRFHISTIVLPDGHTGAIEVGRLKDDIEETMRTYAVIAGAAFPIAIAAAILAGLFLAGRALSPVSRMTDAARRITSDNLSQRIEVRKPDDELNRLASTFNEMISRIENDFNRQKQFTADASHELRTPLTAIQGQAEVTLSRPREPAEYRESLASISAEAARLTRLVNSLLLLARADSGQIKLNSVPVNISNLVADATGRLRPAADARGVKLQAHGEQAAELSGDEQLLLQLLLNLIQNAIEHTPAGGAVTIGWGQSITDTTLWVTDTGRGISPEHLPHLFERFYRADASRSAAHGGSGLGLSICRWIAEAHRGTITVESEPDRGSTFNLRIPRK